MQACNLWRQFDKYLKGKKQFVFSEFRFAKLDKNGIENSDVLVVSMEIQCIIHPSTSTERKISCNPTKQEKLDEFLRGGFVCAFYFFRSIYFHLARNFVWSFAEISKQQQKHRK